jgi:hypothetical protein
MNSLEKRQVEADKMRKTFQAVLDSPKMSEESKAEAQRGMKMIEGLMGAKRLDLTKLQK